MFNFTDKENIGKEYKDFVLLCIDDLPDIKSKGVFLRHKITGLELYHIINDDKENLFAFAFRTLAKDNYGTAHIMEHSTLCGSEKYPLKEPFTTLASQSLNTFLNAMTYPEKTVYPGASLIRDDYFNMLDVYADAVFFPKLDYMTFLQEGHRLEIDEQGNYSIQGVVYNEMKGNYSSFFQIAYSQLVKSMFPDCYPSFDSGGDPLNIPELTYEHFLDFHQKFYHPDNCLLFLYGDIPTQDQIDYFSENFIPRLQKKYNCNCVVDNYSSALPRVKDSIKSLQQLNLHTKSESVKTICCDEGATGSLVARNWYTGKYNQEKIFLSEVLCGNDSSPISKILKESALGDDLITGNFGQYPEELFSIGLSGVKKGNEKKVFELVENAIKQVYEQGISQKDIDSAIMGIDYNLREINRYNGPFSIRLMEMVLKSWTNGLACSTRLSPISSFEELKKKIYSDKKFTEKLIEKYFIKNTVHVDFITEPSPLYLKNRNEGEAKLLQQLKSNVKSEKELKEENEKLHQEQQRKETDDELKCIPHTCISKLDKNLVTMAETKLEFLTAGDNSKIPFFVNDVNTNGIFYIDVCFPFDNLDPKYFQHLPFLSETITSLGWNNKPWDECISEAACVMGDTYGGIITGALIPSLECQKNAQQYKEYNFIDRYWLTLSCKALTSHVHETLKLFSEIITKMDFKDVKRMSQLIKEQYSDSKASFIPEGRAYAMRCTKVFKTYNSTMKEILFGISQLKTIEKYKKTNTKKILKLFSKLYYECISNGAIIHLAADTESLNKIKPLLQAFVCDSKLTSLKPAKERNIKDLIPYVYNGPDLIQNNQQFDMKVNTQTGYACISTSSSAYMSKEYSAQIVLTNWLNGHSLWEKLRTTGGAYGAGCYVDGQNELITMATYRDPTPEKSIQTYLETLKELQQQDFTEEEIEKSVVSIYGDRICPDSPKAMARDSFECFLYGNTPELYKKRVLQILDVKKDDVKKALENIVEGTQNYSKKVVFCDKKIKTSGKKLKMPL